MGAVEGMVGSTVMLMTGVVVGLAMFAVLDQFGNRSMDSLRGVVSKTANRGA